MSTPRREVASQSLAMRLTLQRQMADYKERVAERIALTRERQGMSRETLAYKAGVSVKQLGRIEAGESDPRLSTVRKLADALDATVTDLRPDLEAEERELRDQLDRIETSIKALSRLVQPRLEEFENRLLELEGTDVPASSDTSDPVRTPQQPDG